MPPGKTGGRILCSVLEILNPNKKISMKQNFTTGNSRQEKEAVNKWLKKIKKLVFYSLGYIVIKWLVIFIIGGALYKAGLWNNWHLAGVPIIGITVFIIKKKIKTRKNRSTYVDN